MPTFRLQRSNIKRIQISKRNLYFQSSTFKWKICTFQSSTFRQQSSLLELYFQVAIFNFQSFTLKQQPFLLELHFQQQSLLLQLHFQVAILAFRTPQLHYQISVFTFRAPLSNISLHFSAPLSNLELHFQVAIFAYSFRLNFHLYSSRLPLFIIFFLETAKKKLETLGLVLMSNFLLSFNRSYRQNYFIDL